MRKLGIEDMTFQLEYGASFKEFMGARAEVRITPLKNFTVILFREAYLDPDVRMGLFSVHHELCHVKLYRMGFPITNDPFIDKKRWPNHLVYNKLCVICEWYANELQRRVFDEYHGDFNGKGEVVPYPPPFEGLPPLPKESFTKQEIDNILSVAKADLEEAG